MSGLAFSIQQEQLARESIREFEDLFAYFAKDSAMMKEQLQSCTVEFILYGRRQYEGVQRETHVALRYVETLLSERLQFRGEKCKLVILPALPVRLKLSIAFYDGPWRRRFLVHDICPGVCKRWRSIDSLRWPCETCQQKIGHERFIHTVVALVPLRLPVYVMLWILDWLPEFQPNHSAAPAVFCSELKRIRAIEAVVAAFNKRKKSRLKK